MFNHYRGNFTQSYEKVTISAYPFMSIKPNIGGDELIPHNKMTPSHPCLTLKQMHPKTHMAMSPSPCSASPSPNSQVTINPASSRCAMPQSCPQEPSAHPKECDTSWPTDSEPRWHEDEKDREYFSVID
jgi:hypothetical protein